MMGNGSKVCVTGAAGYIGSWLVNKLLDKGYTVHATLRNLKDESKVGLLKGFPHANDRLVLFEADIYNPHEFEPAIQGCHFVFHVAIPKQHHTHSQFNNMSEAAVSGAKSIVMSCIKSGTVKRLIYTASVVSASPLKDDGSGFKDSIDETCWTPLNLSFEYNNDLHQEYTNSKTLTEREILSYDKSKNGGELEVVTLACGLVGGETLLSSLPLSVTMFISQLKDNEIAFHSVRFLEELLGKIPIVHVDDVCEAHIFCIEKPSISGRFLVASSYVSSADIANYYLQTYPECHVQQKYLNGPTREIKWASTKLTDQAFVYKYDTKMILDDCIRCATRIHKANRVAMEKSCKVCVTGGAGYIGSWLVKKLLDKGYTVHATLRDLKNESKAGLLKSLPHAEARLVLFEADIYNPNEFAPAIQGCEFVFHVATPMQHQLGSQYKNMIEAAVAGSKSIAESCIIAGTVRRLIYTGSVVAASPLKDDGSGFKDSMDETCWTPLNTSISHLFHDDFHREYTYSKTLIEKDMLSYGSRLEVVTLPCGLVGGDTLLSFISASSIAVFVSQLTENTKAYQSLKCLEELLGKVPLVHIDDVCEAHIFCMENPSINGRFLCVSSYISSEDIAGYYFLHHPEIQVKQEYVNGPKREIKWGSTKLTDKGFVYKYDTKKILDDCIRCARRMGDL